ncbi:sigma-54 interaction domain-containing protein [Aneurinibacillus sp. UBA3580]|uniref:sigma-54 interaction domain-containing protein n=1 Tax=Aneurinibacillus sp. UBA3580 TaxID=1946041 RepID=UPI00257BD099|nr:sigma 54-interacting transcriptional regulator [Aneurinibacillus sp. UBA3580]
MLLSEFVRSPKYTVDLNLLQSDSQRVISEMKALSLLEAPVSNEGRWAGIFRVFPSVQVFPSGSTVQFTEFGVWMDDAPYLYADTEIKEWQFLTDHNIIGVVNKEEEFLGVIYVADLQREIHSMYKKASERNREMDAIIDNAYDGILIADALGYVTRVNPSFCRLTGVNEQSFVGVHLTELVKQGIFKEPSVTWQSLQERREVSGLQRYPTGQEHLVTSVPIFDQAGKIQGVVANVRDMSELSRLREELAEVQDQSQLYKTELSNLRKRVFFDEIVAVSPQMRNVRELAERVANFDSTVLVLGESGVGKEVIASLIHKASARSQGPFVKINCGALSEELLESELFGYESGAFTGARKAGKIGLFEAAEGGCIFLDEIGEMSPALQVKVLRVLQEQEFTRVGGVEPIQVNCRIIAATHRNLKEQIRKGLFREDLYYRLYVVPLHIPPLRERKEDIPAMLQYFLNKYNQKYGTQKTIHPVVIQLLQHYSWPGNVRQLSNLIERMVVTIPETVICEHHLPEDFFNLENSSEDSSLDVLKKTGNRHISIKTKVPNKSLNAFNEMERDIIIQSLSRFGSIRKVAQALGVSHTAIIKKMKKYGIEKN